MCCLQICQSLNSSAVSTQDSFLSAQLPVCPCWDGLPVLFSWWISTFGGVASLPSLGTVVYAQVLCTLGQSSEVHYTLLAYWYVGTPRSDHVAPNLTCIQCPLLQSTSNTQILGSHFSSRPSWAGTFSSWSQAVTVPTTCSHTHDSSQTTCSFNSHVNCPIQPKLPAQVYQLAMKANLRVPPLMADLSAFLHFLELQKVVQVLVGVFQLLYSGQSAQTFKRF